MAANTDPDKRMLEIIKKEAEITDDELSELRRLLSQLTSAAQSIFAGSYSNVAAFRMNIELIAAIRNFDRTSARLTTAILIVTCVALIPVVRDLIGFLRTFAR